MLIICFYLLVLAVIAYQDFKSHEFYTFLLIPLFGIALIAGFHNFHSYLQQSFKFMIIFVLFVYLVLSNKLGSGDLWCYLASGIAIGPEKTLNILLFTCFMVIIAYLFFLDKKQEIGLIPYLFFSTCLFII